MIDGPRRSFARFAWTLLPAIALAAPLGADTLILKDGRLIDGRKLARVEQGIEIEFENGKVLVPLALIEDALIEGEAPPEPSTPQEREQIAKGLVRYQGKWVSIKRRDELIAKALEEKREELADLAAHREWRNRRIETTKHFVFEYTIPPSVFARYRDWMEAYFTSFTKQWNVSPPRDMKKLVVCLHRDHEAMSDIAGVSRNVLGYFNPFGDRWEANFFYDRLDPALSEEVMFHETNHYLQRLIDVDFRYPHFPGEAVAEYWGASQWDPHKKKLESGLVLEGRLVQIHADIDAGERMSLAKLVSTDDLFEHYTWGWSLVHFLMSEPKTAKQFQQFFMALPTSKEIRREVYGNGLKTCTGEEVWKAFRRHLDLDDEKDVIALERAWHAYVENELALVSAAGLEKGAASFLHGNPPRPMKAKRFLEEAIAKGSQNPMTFHRYAGLLESDGQTDKALENWKKALQLDPLNADFYAALGRVHFKKGDKQEARRLRRLARELDPDDAWLSLDDQDLEDVGEDGKKPSGG